MGVHGMNAETYSLAGRRPAISLVGMHRRARAYAEKSLAIRTQLNDLSGQAHWVSLGPSVSPDSIPVAPRLTPAIRAGYLRFYGRHYWAKEDGRRRHPLTGQYARPGANDGAARLVSAQACPSPLARRRSTAVARGVSDDVGRRSRGAGAVLAIAVRAVFSSPGVRYSEPRESYG